MPQQVTRIRTTAAFPWCAKDMTARLLIIRTCDAARSPNFWSNTIP
jgi:hypothetical protein